jgi:hypothetical protein
MLWWLRLSHSLLIKAQICSKVLLVEDCDGPKRHGDGG